MKIVGATGTCYFNGALGRPSGIDKSGEPCVVLQSPVQRLDAFLEQRAVGGMVIPGICHKEEVRMLSNKTAYQHLYSRPH